MQSEIVAVVAVGAMLVFCLGALWVVWQSFRRVEAAQRDLVKAMLVLRGDPNAAFLAGDMERTDRETETAALNGAGQKREQPARRIAT